MSLLLPLVLVLVLVLMLPLMPLPMLLLATGPAGLVPWNRSRIGRFLLCWTAAATDFAGLQPLTDRHRDLREK